MYIKLQVMTGAMQSFPFQRSAVIFRDTVTLRSEDYKLRVLKDQGLQ